MKKDKASELASGRLFSLESIEKTDPPDPADKNEWYRYRIANAMSPIEGIRSGSLKSVTAYLKEYVDNLNARSATGTSTYGNRTTKK